MNVVSTTDLGRRYGRTWAIRHLDLGIADGSITGIVGPNGAGKSTLLHTMAGLAHPTEGTVSVFGDRPGERHTLPDVAFVAQDAPLPRRARIGELVAMARAMNVRWDGLVVDERCHALGLSEHQRIASLSGGQRAQLALALALAKQPRLLLLDEPVASLDPLARREFLGVLMAAVAVRRLTVVFSTHLLDDLERTCDHLIVLEGGVLRLAGPIDAITATHCVLIGPADRPLPPGVRSLTGGARAHQQLVAVDRAIIDPTWQQATVGIEEIVLAYLASTSEPEPARRLEVA